MESPATWTRLTASLAVRDFGRANDAWAFLVVQGLVRDEPGDRDAFAEFVRAEQTRGPITGPTLASRVAGHLVRAGIALPAGHVPDPEGAVATERMTTLTGWRTGAESDRPRPKPWWKWW